MAEENGDEPKGEADATPPPTPGMKVLSQYIRDLSFENAVVDKGVSSDIQPEIEVSVALDARKRPDEGQFEVIQKYKIKSKAKGSGDPLFILELEYGAVFQLTNVSDQQMHPFLLIECPRMVFPYVRRIVGDVTRDGGFPALNLDSVDFVQLYRQELRRRAQAQSANTVPV